MFFIEFGFSDSPFCNDGDRAVDVLKDMRDLWLFALICRSHADESGTYPRGHCCHRDTHNAGPVRCDA